MPTEEYAKLEAVQPLCQIVQLVHIDCSVFQALENGIPAVQLYDIAVLPQSPPGTGRRSCGSEGIENAESCFE